MSTRRKWARWVRSLPAYAPEWTSARYRWAVREHARRMLPHIGLTAEQAAEYREFYGLSPDGPAS